MAQGRVSEDATGRMSLVERVNWMYFEMLVRIYIFVRRLVTYFSQKLLLYLTRPDTKVVLVIGDGIAEGVGDSLARGGLAPRLQVLFDSLRRETNLTLRWHVFTAGRLHTTAADWAPGSALLERALVAGPYARAAVVALVIGAHDSGSQDAPRNIARTAEAAARLGKHVVVCAMPNFAERRTAAHALAVAQAKVLGEALSEARERLRDAENAGTIDDSASFEKILARRGDVVRIENTFTTLNSIGYRGFAREIFDHLVLAARKVEWAHWKTRI